MWASAPGAYDEGAYAFVDGVAVVGNDAAMVEDVIDVARGVQESMADDPDFIDTVAGLPEGRLAMAYASTRNIADRLAQLSGMAVPSVEESLDALASGARCGHQPVGRARRSRDGRGGDHRPRTAHGVPTRDPGSRRSRERPHRRDPAGRGRRADAARHRPTGGRRTRPAHPARCGAGPHPGEVGLDRPGRGPRCPHGRYRAGRAADVGGRNADRCAVDRQRRPGGIGLGGHLPARRMPAIVSAGGGGSPRPTKGSRSRRSTTRTRPRSRRATR